MNIKNSELDGILESFGKMLSISTKDLKINELVKVTKAIRQVEEASKNFHEMRNKIIKEFYEVDKETSKDGKSLYKIKDMAKLDEALKAQQELLDVETDITVRPIQISKDIQSKDLPLQMVLALDKFFEFI